ncbi:MAG: hypothetical protein WC520_01435 [Candidatus Paceibacterota bacterium]
MDLAKAFTVLGLEDRKNECQLIAPDFSDVTICYDGKSRAYGSKATKIWEEHLELCPDSFNGRMASVKNFGMRANLAIKKRHLLIWTRPSKFSDFVGTQYLRPERLLPTSSSLDRYYSLPLSFGAVSLTAPSARYPERAIIFGIRGDTAFDKYKATLLPGGYFDPTKDCYIEIVKGVQKKYLSLKKAVVRELEEELGINSFTSLKLSELLYSRTGSRQPLISVEIVLPDTAEQIMEFAKLSKEPELREIICVPANISSLAEFVSAHNLCPHDVRKLARWVANYFK